MRMRWIASPEFDGGWRVRACGISPQRAFDARDTKIGRGPKKHAQLACREGMGQARRAGARGRDPHASSQPGRGLGRQRR